MRFIMIDNEEYSNYFVKSFLRSFVIFWKDQNIYIFALLKIVKN